MSKTVILQTDLGPMKGIMHGPTGILTPDGDLEIPNRIFLGGISSETTELNLETFFAKFGLVKDVRIVTDRHTGESKGYGFVTFDETEDITQFLKKQNIVVDGKKLRIRKAIRRKNSSQFQNSDSESPSSEASSVNIVSQTTDQNCDSEPVVMVPANVNSVSSPSQSNSWQPMNYSQGYPRSTCQFIPTGQQQGATQQFTSSPQQLYHQSSTLPASYQQAVYPQPYHHPFWYISCNPALPPAAYQHHPGYPMYQTI